MAGRATAKTELFSHWRGGAMVIADEGMSTGGRLWVRVLARPRPATA